MALDWQPGIFLPHSFGDTGTASSAQALAGFPVQNILDTDPDLIAKLDPNPVIDIDLAAGAVSDMIAFMQHNMSATAQITIAAYKDQARTVPSAIGVIRGDQIYGLDEIPGLDNGPLDGPIPNGSLLDGVVIDVHKGAYGLDDFPLDLVPLDGIGSTVKYHDTVILLSALSDDLYWSFQILDDQEVHLARIKIGQKLQMMLNFEWGSAMGFSTSQVPYRETEVSYLWINEGEAATVNDLIRSHASPEAVRTLGGALINYRDDVVVYLYPQRGGPNEAPSIALMALTNATKPTEINQAQTQVSLKFEEIYHHVS